MRNKKYFIVCLVLSLLIPTYLFAWGLATHVYFADQLGKSRGYLNLQEMYGATVPDMYKTMFISPYFDYWWSQTHQEFPKVVSHATTNGQKAFAYGYTSHNDVWGADYTAHHEGRTTPGIGYVYAQIAVLTPLFEDSIEQVLLDNRIDPEQAKALAAEFAPSVAHVAVETSVDILMKRIEDPGIGAKIRQAAQLRSPAIPGLLVAAYAADFAQEFELSIVTATAIILGAETGFREYASYYGYIFTKKEPEIIRLLSVHGADLAELFMRMVKGLEINVPSEAVADLLVLTIAHVESNYSDEIAATLAYLENKLPSHGIALQSQSDTLQDETEVENTVALAPQECLLAQNQPNPFNPTTTINYSLAKDSHVRITIYNVLGQVVAVLVDGYRSKGSYSVTWDAQHQPGGLYIYRLEAAGFSESKKMFLQK